MLIINNKKYLLNGYLFLIISILWASVLFASSSSTNYSIPSQGVGGGGGKSSSSSYTSHASAGLVAASKMTSTNYTLAGGSLNGGSSGSGDTSGPSITDVKIDSKVVANNDYVKPTGTLTARISDEVGVSLTNSSIEVDGVKTQFSALSGASSYDTTAKTLTYAMALGSGTHTIKIYAIDIAGNTTSLTRIVVAGGGALSASSVLIYPNPFNPSAGNAKVAYTLTDAADISILFFNAVGQLVLKRDFVSGASGATAGYNEYAWDGKDSGGEVVGNDLYFVRIVSGGKIIGKAKLAVLK